MNCSGAWYELLHFTGFGFHPVIWEKRQQGHGAHSTKSLPAPHGVILLPLKQFICTPVIGGISSPTAPPLPRSEAAMAMTALTVATETWETGTGAAPTRWGRHRPPCRRSRTHTRYCWAPWAASDRAESWLSLPPGSGNESMPCAGVGPQRRRSSTKVGGVWHPTMKIIGRRDWNGMEPIRCCGGKWWYTVASHVGETRRKEPD
jgi:hypothetical protein